MPQAVTFAPPVISADIEDWPQSTWNRDLPITERAAANTQRVLGILDEAGVSATMFVLGKFAEAFPNVVREIHARGHEVASHGHGHIEVFKQSRDEFATDIRRSKDVLEQILGVAISGYRAPDFSIVRGTLWALEVLAETGFEYDSSIFPVYHQRYGIPDWPTGPVKVALPIGSHIIEFPIATFRCFGRNLPVGGGGYHRLLPGRITRMLAQRVMGAVPFVFYCHPYEFDPLEFRETALQIPWSVRLHQGLGRSRFTGRFQKLLRRFGGRPVKDLLSSCQWPELTLERNQSVHELPHTYVFRGVKTPII